MNITNILKIKTNAPLGNTKFLLFSIIVTVILMSIITYIFVGITLGNIGILISILFGSVVGVIGVLTTAVLLPIIKSIFGELN